MPENWIRLSTDALSLDQLQGAARELVKMGAGFTTWLFYGEMGSGKTTLIKYLVKELGLNSLVTSPTFSIVNEYSEPGKNPVYHFDLYRLKNEVEALDIGFDEYLSSGNLCLIEWPEKVESLLPIQFFGVKILYRDALSREIFFCRHDGKETNRI
ncbi:MAG: tRNA (adenosine(37)-N6)-threonylcarbamoyltransferase complex ATPase subunit type 1 TsaE [Cyclobacteriaceae bacterium]|nr:tRNA (adenosine(37)-N6)-threonylcarbamoyltransferase complex ATPase subunit type 1 TsaE [Cyclobacteriaceae bacterium]